MDNYKYIIIGAGLSGLTTAYELTKQGEQNFVILEGRERVGGRILTQSNIDIGPTWIHQPHTNVKQLCKDLGLSLFDQHNSGKSMMVYDINAKPHYFESDPREVPSHRITGGTFALIEALSNKLSDKIILNSEVTKIKDKNKQLLVEVNNSVYSANRVVVTLPPSLASLLNYDPELPMHLKEAMSNKHTWMSNAIKFGITFKNAFWRAKGMSGTIIGQTVPVIELYDHASNNSDTFALMGFVNETLREFNVQKRKDIILSYLERYFGEEIKDYLDYEEKDWSIDPFTQKGAVIPRYLGAHYGDSCFNDLYMGGKLLFSGTETSPIHGGYLEGAVISGSRATRLLSE